MKTNHLLSNYSWVSVALSVLDQVLGQAPPCPGPEGSAPGARPDLEVSVERAGDELLARPLGQHKQVSVAESGHLAHGGQTLQGGPAVALDGGRLASLLARAVAAPGTPDVDAVSDSGVEDLAHGALAELGQLAVGADYKPAKKKEKI